MRHMICLPIVIIATGRASRNARVIVKQTKRKHKFNKIYDVFNAYNGNSEAYVSCI